LTEKCHSAEEFGHACWQTVQGGVLYRVVAAGPNLVLGSFQAVAMHWGWYFNELVVVFSMLAGHLLVYHSAVGGVWDCCFAAFVMSW
jgi:hypothetical protein